MKKHIICSLLIVGVAFLMYLTGCGSNATGGVGGSAGESGDIVFSSSALYDNNSTSEVTKTDLNGAGRTVLIPSTESGYPPHKCAKISPDRTKIAVGYLDPNNARNNRIMLMNADGSGQTTFEASDTYEAYKFAWSPDSSKIAYFANKNGGSIYYTYIKPVSAGSSTQLSTGETVLVNDKSEYGPSFSRDSQYVAYAKKQSTTIPDDIWFAKADGSGTPTEERLTSTAVTKEYAPSFSPTESNILICIASYNSGYYIHKLNINNTTEVTVLTSSKFGELLDGPLIWSSDGQWIYFTGGKSTDTNSRTYRIPASGGSGEVISQVDLVDAIDVAKFPGIERVYYIRTTWDVSSEGWYVPMPTGTPVKVIDNGKYNYFDYSNGHYW